jgi:putative tricarboxylic transport membrane protein
VKLDDTIWGVLVALLGAGLLLHIQGFPAMPGQHIGPAFFPGALGIGLVVCGLILAVRGWRARAAAGTGAPWLALQEWSRSPRHVLGFALLVGVNLVYLFGVDRLGFVITGTLYLATLMWVLRVRPLWILPVAVVMTLLIHFAFYKLLRVPLPWGLLQPVAW